MSMSEWEKAPGTAPAEFEYACFCRCCCNRDGRTLAERLDCSCKHRLDWVTSEFRASMFYVAHIADTVGDPETAAALRKLERKISAWSPRWRPVDPEVPEKGQ